MDSYPSRNGAASRRRSFPARAAATVATAFLIACALQLWTACRKQDPNADPKVVMGRGVYLSNCIACHNMNPERDGSLGPAIKGSALDLLQARVLRGEYPPGYSPKRPTKIMVKLPLMEADVEAVHAYLNAP
jgi:mono/diheme cytochrome c family protein